MTIELRANIHVYCLRRISRGGNAIAGVLDEYAWATTSTASSTVTYPSEATNSFRAHRLPVFVRPAIWRSLLIAFRLELSNGCCSYSTRAQVVELVDTPDSGASR